MSSVCKCSSTWSYRYSNLPIRENGDCDQRYCTECGTVQQWSDKLKCWQIVGTL